MPKKRPKSATKNALPLGLWLRPVCLAFATALVVAAPLIPSERTEMTGAALPQAMLWLLAALVWFAGVWLTQQPMRRFDVVDAAAFLLAGWIATSGVAMMNQGAPRPTLNAIWTWTSLIVAFLLLRQLLRSQREVRALCAVLMGVAVCLSVIAIHQTFIAYPAMRELYRRDPEAALRDANISAPPGTVQRKQFEDRLNSTEPNATFSLTNSLAGFVAPWLVILVAVASSRRVFSDAKKNRELEALATWAMVLLLAACLLLTKSRSAWLATLLGVIGIALAHGTIAGGQRPAVSQRLVGLGILGTMITTIALLVAAGILDIEILSQAGRSLAFRWEYWQATLEMIRDYPLWGIGVGNFQEYYTAYKFPQASETIADPHNFVLEIMANSGVLAIMIFVALVGLVARNLARPASEEPRAPAPQTAPKVALNTSHYIFAGGAAGVLLAVVLGLVTDYLPDLFPLLLGAVVGGFAVWTLSDWVENGALPRWLMAVAIVVLLVNLLAAGGIAFPGVAITLWVLLAAFGAGEGSQSRIDRPRAALAALATVVLIAACYTTAYQPVLARQRLTSAIKLERSDLNATEAIELAVAAAAADPWSADPHLLLAQLHFERWLAGDGKSEDDSTDWRAFEQHAADAQARNRRAFSPLVLLGYHYWEAYERTRDPRLLSRALRLVNQSVELYPHDALGRAQLAWLFAQADLPGDAQREASEALRLDTLCPHRERKLAARRLFGEIAGVRQQRRASPELETLNAEQWMERLRKTQGEAADENDKSSANRNAGA